MRSGGSQDPAVGQVFVCDRYGGVDARGIGDHEKHLPSLRRHPTNDFWNNTAYGTTISAIVGGGSVHGPVDHIKDILGLDLLFNQAVSRRFRA